MRKQGEETHALMQETNKNLRQQRELIIDAHGKVQETDAQVAKTGKLVETMTRKEYCTKLWIMAVIVLTFLADLGLLIKLLSKTF